MYTNSIKNREKYGPFLKEWISKKIDKKDEDLLISFCFEVENLNILSIFDLKQNGNDSLFYFQKPEEGYSFLGINNLFSATADGPDRIILTENKFKDIKHKLIHNWDEIGLDFVPLVMGGMKFSSSRKSSNWNDYADSDWFIPQFILLDFNKNYYFVHNFFYRESEKPDFLSGVEELFLTIKKTLINSIKYNYDTILSSTEDNEEQKAEWIKKVNSALKEIKNNKYSKIVLSRSVSLTFNSGISITPLLEKLAADYPRCYIFAFKQNQSVFFGASPEKLAKLFNGIIEADALAGSLPRGETEIEDKDLENQLLNSKKNLAEQNAVVDFITNSFSQFSSKIEYSRQPIIRKLPNIQHLWTPIKAKMNGEYSIFSILKNIHPTPAICGTPWSIALDSIRETEEHDRGLFAGIIGWFNFDQQGDFAVSIRSALLKDNQLNAYAGCGIVEGSDPLLEYEESKLKLKPILSLFRNETIGQP